MWHQCWTLTHSDILVLFIGEPRKFLSNNREESSDENCREMNEKLNIETATTAGESPFSNGIVEWHNQILIEAFYKTIADVKCE